MKKIFTLIAVAAMAASFSAKADGVTDEKTVILGYTSNDDLSHKDFDSFTTAGTAKNVLALADGFELAITSRGDKAYSSAQPIEVNGENYTTIKLSNGATNTLFAPEGNVITKLTLYSYINYNPTDKGTEGRTSYWKEVAGTEYTADDATILNDWMDVTDYKANPDKVEFPINNLASVTFTNTGEQLCFVMEVTYGKGETAGIVNVNAAEENAPIYNLQGVQVDENYKGIVIKNGKKYINK